MTKPFTQPLIVAMAVLALSVTSAYADATSRLRNSIKILDELTEPGDNAIPAHLLERAEAVIVIPSFMKAGFIVGAEHGKGILSLRDRATNTWSAPAFVKMSGGSFGAQIGVQAADLVLLVMNRRGVDQLLQDTFTIGGNIAAAAGPVGRAAGAATDYHGDAQILAYSRAKGLFAGATLNGTVLKADESAIKEFYGRNMSIREIVLENQVRADEAPRLVAEWREAIARHTGGSTERPVSTSGR